MSQEQLAAILEKGDSKACMEFFAGLSEKERQGYAEPVRTWFKSLCQDAFRQTKSGTFERNPLMEAAAVAVQAACSLSDLKQFGWRALPEADLHFAIFAARRPAWLDDWATWLCEAVPHRWPLVRRFVCQGLCRAPRTDHYVLGMIVGVCAYHDNKNTIYSALLEDPDLLQNDIWRLFEVEGEKEFCLASRDKYSRADNHWTYALVRLAQEQKLSRARLLDASLDALQRDFAQFHAGWFSQFHGALVPTPKERQERHGAYLALLASKIPPTVSFALTAIQILVAEDKIDFRALVSAIKPALWSRQKGTARLALQLLEQTARKHPELMAQVGALAGEALAHESPDVQGHALKLLDKYAGPLPAELARALSERLDHVAASHRSRLQKLIAVNAPFAEESSPTGASSATRRIGRMVRQKQPSKNVPKRWTRNGACWLAWTRSCAQWKKTEARFPRSTLTPLPFRAWIQTGESSQSKSWTT